MGRFVNPDNSAFQVALNSAIYVDKTGLIKYTNQVLNTMEGYICNSRPRRFGKSYAANMLSAYYSKGADSETLFAGTEISCDDDFRTHLNRYDVIHIDIQWFLSNADTAESVVPLITKNVLTELSDLYPGVLSAETGTLPDALSRIKNQIGQKFVIIIDEWDVLIRDADVGIETREIYIQFLRGLFKGTEPTKYIQLAYLTGILPIKKEKTQSALNNFDEFTMLSPGVLTPYFGFTGNEVQHLAETYHRDFEKIKRWYNGYWLNDDEIYNPRSVVSVMLRGEFKSYWSETASYETIVPLINRNYDGLKTAVIEMLSGAMVHVNTTTFGNDAWHIRSKDDVLTYLIHLGYLGYDRMQKTAFVPNEEIRQELTVAAESEGWNELIRFQNASEDLLNATLDLKSDVVAEKIEKIHNDYASVIRYHDENALSSTLAIAYLSSMQYYFKPIRELPTGRGFADFVYLPRPEYKDDYPALVVELKWNRGAETALRQIKDRNYPESVQNYTGMILLVAISYDKQSKDHHCLIETCVKASNQWKVR